MATTVHPSICAMCGANGQSRVNLSDALPHDLRAFLFNNAAPSETEQEILRATAEGITTVMRALDTQIEAVTAILAGLKDDKLRAESKLFEVKAILHPIRTLPADIISEIMLSTLAPFEAMFVDKTLHIELCNSISPTFPSWTLSQICKPWRELAISVSKLWRYVLVDFAGVASATYASTSDGAMTFKWGLFLERSRHCELSVFLLLRGPTWEGHPLLGLLKGSTARWRRLFIGADPAQLSTFEGLSFPQLKKLEFIAPGEAPSVVTTFQDSCPNLEELILIGNSLVFIVVPWHHLKALTLFGTVISTAQNLPALRSLTALEDFFITCRNGSVTPDSLQSVLRLPSLRRLLVREHPPSAGGISQTIPLFDRQAVAKVKFCFPARASMQLPHPTPHLQPAHLTIECDLCHHDNSPRLIRFLTATPSVQNLSLETDIPEDFLRSLSVQDHTVGSLILPELQSLEVREFDTPVAHPESLLDLVESRFRENASFELLDATTRDRLTLAFDDPAHTSRWNTYLARRYGVEVGSRAQLHVAPWIERWI